MVSFFSWLLRFPSVSPERSSSCQQNSWGKMWEWRKEEEGEGPTTTLLLLSPLPSSLLPSRPPPSPNHFFLLILLSSFPRRLGEDEGEREILYYIHTCGAPSSSPPSPFYFSFPPFFLRSDDRQMWICRRRGFQVWRCGAVLLQNSKTPPVKKRSCFPLGTFAAYFMRTFGCVDITYALSSIPIAAFMCDGDTLGQRQNVSRCFFMLSMIESRNPPLHRIF